MLNHKTGMTRLASRAIRNSYLAALGAVAMTQRETQTLVDEMIERGEEVDRQNRTTLKRLVRRGKKEVREVEREIEARTADIVATTGVMTRNDVDLLQYRVERLSDEVDEMVSEAEGENRRRQRERREAAAREREQAERDAAQREAQKGRQEARDTAKETKDAGREAQPAPWRGYDQMRVPEILERIPRLSDGQLEEVRRYEAANANHKGVLDAIDEQLNKRQPFPEYRTLPAAEVSRQIADMDIDQALAVREYEKAHANRVSVVRATERRLGELIGIADYPDLSVGEVVERLPEMSDEDLAKVRRFEANHENRQGVLRAIDRIEAERMPLPNYGGMTVDEIAAQVATLNADGAQAVGAYETGHHNRVTVVRAVEKRLEAIEQEKAQAQENGAPADKQG